MKQKKNIYNWIIFNRTLGNAISTWAVAIEFIKSDIKELEKHNINKENIINVGETALCYYMQRKNYMYSYSTTKKM